MLNTRDYKLEEKKKLCNYRKTNFVINHIQLQLSENKRKNTFKSVKVKQV